MEKKGNIERPKQYDSAYEHIHTVMRNEICIYAVVCKKIRKRNKITMLFVVKHFHFLGYVNMKSKICMFLKNFYVHNNIAYLHM